MANRNARNAQQTARKVAKAMQDCGVLPKPENGSTLSPVAKGVLRAAAKPIKNPDIMTIPYIVALVWVVCTVVGFVLNVACVAIGVAAAAGVGMFAYKKVTGHDLTLPSGQTVPEWLRLRAAGGKE